MTGGEGYAQRHLQQSDYYDQNRNVEGYWQGRGAELLGLKAGGHIPGFCQRSAQRDAAIQEFTNSRGRAPTDNEVAVLVRETRADKLQEISTEQIRSLQQDRLTPDERRSSEPVAMD